MDDQQDFIARRGRRAISRWREPLDGEPAYGFLMRLADAHREDSMAAFATALGLEWVSSIALDQCLLAAGAAEFASDADRARLRRWTPVMSPSFRELAGTTVRRDDFSLRTRRYCPACLAESPHHRVWFDLLFMTQCPLHGIAIRDRPEGWVGPPALWNAIPLDSLSCGMTLKEPGERLPALAETLEGYTLRRLGLAPARPDPFLDPFALGDVVEGAELVGRLVVGGWRESMPLIGSPGFGADVLQCEGWKVLRDGRDGVRACLSRIARQAPRRTFGARKLFGWAYYNMSLKGDLALELRALLIEVARSYGLQGRQYTDGRRGMIGAATLASESPIALYDLADAADATATLDKLSAVADRTPLREIAKAVADPTTAAGIASTIGCRVTARDVAAVAGADVPLRDLFARLPERLTVREIAVLIGESENAVVGLGRARRLFLPHDGRKGTPLLARKADLASFLCSAEAAVTRSEAIAMLGVPARTFAEIVLAGHIEKFGTRWETVDEARERGGARAGAVEDRFEIAEIERFLDSIPLKAPEDLTPSKAVLMAPHVKTVVDMLAYTRIDAGEFFTAVANGDVVVYTRLRLPRPRRSATSFAFQDALADFRIRLCDQRPGHPFTARWLSVAFTREQSITPDGLSQRQACALLDVNPPTAKVLTDLGYFKLLPSKDRCDRHKLERASVEAFASRYAAGKIYAQALDCQDAKVPDRARKAGVETLWESEHAGLDLGRVNAIYARADMRRAFGWTDDPDAFDPVLNGWKAMADRIGREKSLFALWQVKPGIEATFSTSDRLWPIDVSYVFGAEVPDVARHVSFEDERDHVPSATYEIRAELDVAGKSGAERVDAFASAIARGLPQGIEASFNAHEGRFRASMRAVLVVEDECLSPTETFRRHVEDDVPVVALMLSTIKAAFEFGARDFDPTIFGLWPVAFTRIRRRERAA